MQRIREFETGISRFESEKVDLSDVMAIDRRRLLAGVEARTDGAWTEARSKFADLAKKETPPGFDEDQARAALGAALENHFEAVAHKATEQARAELIDRLGKHETKASALLAQVRLAAAELMEISVRLPPPEDAFERAREAYWVAPAPQNSIIDASALAAIRFLPNAMREKRLRAKIGADTERAVLRNVANLDWALRQNVEEAFRRFEAALARQLSAAIEETREVMQIALDTRSARFEEVSSLIAQTQQSIAALSAVVENLELAKLA